MKRRFNFTISGCIVLIAIILIFVGITGYVYRPETSKLGSISMKTGQKCLYIADPDINILLPSEYNGYFADTKSSVAADVLKKRSLTYVGEGLDDEYEIHVRVLKNDSFTPETYEDILYNISDVYEYIEYVNAGYQEYNGIKLYHYMASRSDVVFKEYHIVSGYVGESNNNVYSLELVKLFDSEKYITDEGNALEHEFSQIIESIGYGKGSVSASSKGILSYSFSLWIFLIIIVYIAFSNMKYAEDYGVYADNMDHRHTKNILGIFSVLIVLHHLVQSIGAHNAGFMGIMEYFGVCFVGVFFFYSGYGLLRSLHSKEGYLKSFLKNRLLAVLIPFGVCNLIFVIDEAISGSLHGFGDICKKIFGITLINTQMWYVIEVLFLYVAFWIIFSFIKNEKIAIVLMGSFVVIMMVGSLLLGHGQYWFQGEWWYNSTLLFWLGMIFERHRDSIENFVIRHYKVALGTAIISFVILWIYSKHMLDTVGYWTEYQANVKYGGYLDKLITLVPQLLMVISFTGLIYVIGLKCSIGNKVCAFLGTISLEVYLIHNFFIKLFSFVGGAGVYFLIVIICSIIAGTLIHNVNVILIGKLTRKPPVGLVKVQLKRVNKRKISVSAILKPRNIRRFFKRSVRELVCIFLSLLSLFPAYEMIMYGTRNKSAAGIILAPGGHFLENINAMNYEFASAGGGIYKGIINSCIVSIPSAILATYIAAMTAYAIERYKFKGRDVIWKMIIAFMLVPSYAGFIGYLRMITRWGLLNNYLSVILPAAATPSAVYFIRMYLRNFNFYEVTEAARIDGAGEFKIFNKIIIPMIKPALALQLTFSFMASWNAGASQSLLLMKLDVKTISGYIAMLGSGKNAGNDPAVFALLSIATIVPVIIYVLCSKHIVNSITLGAVKE